MAEYMCPVVATSLPVAGGMLAHFITRNAKPQTRTPPSSSLSRRIAGITSVTSLACMGYGSSLIYREFGGMNGDGATPLALYGTTLLLSLSKAPLLVKTNTKVVTVAQTAALGTAIAAFFTFYKIDHKAAYFMLPYVLWTLYQTCWQVSVMRSNAGGKGIR